MIQFPTTHNADAWKPVVVAALTDLAPSGGEVRFALVLAWCEAQSSFPGWDTWGTSMKRGKPYPKGHRSVTLAAGKLKDEGALRSPRRGYYALTSSSMDVAAPVMAPVAPEAPMPVQTPTEPVKAPVSRPVRLNVVTKDGVQFTPKSTATNSAAYVAADAGLRRMAAEQTRCFGAWSSRSSQCGECPLAGLCQQAGMTDFAEIAAALDAATAAEITAAEAKVAAPEAPEAPAQNETPIPVSSNGVTVPFACPCHDCGKTIPAGTVAHYRDAVNGGGVFHMDCVPA
jgi:hypothetical protein